MWIKHAYCGACSPLFVGFTSCLTGHLASNCDEVAADTKSSAMPRRLQRARSAQVVITNVNSQRKPIDECPRSSKYDEFFVDGLPLTSATDRFKIYKVRSPSSHNSIPSFEHAWWTGTTECLNGFPRKGDSPGIPSKGQQLPLAWRYPQ